MGAGVRPLIDEIGFCSAVRVVIIIPQEGVIAGAEIVIAGKGIPEKILTKNLVNGPAGIRGGNHVPGADHEIPQPILLEITQ